MINVRSNTILILIEAKDINFLSYSVINKDQTTKINHSWIHDIKKKSFFHQLKVSFFSSLLSVSA